MGVLGLASSKLLGTGFASSAAKDFYSVNINSATLAYLKNITWGYYTVPQNREQIFYILNIQNEITIEQDISDIAAKSAVFGGFPYKKFHFYFEISSSEGFFPGDFSRTFVDGFAYGMSYEIIGSLHVGVFFDYLNYNSKNYLSANVGLLHTLDVNKAALWRLGVFSLNFSASLLIRYTDVLAREYNATYPFGISIHFFKLSKYLNVFYDSTLYLDGELRNLVVSNGIRIKVFDIVSFSFGFSGGDFLIPEKIYYGLGLTIPIKRILWNIDVSYHTNRRSIDEAKGFRETTINNFTFSMDMQYRLDADYGDADDLIFFTDPKNVFTPNGDGENDVLFFYLAHKRIDTLKYWNLNVFDVNKKVVININPLLFDQKVDSTYDFPEKISWLGINYKGLKAKDGVYSFELTTVDTKNKELKWSLGDIILDSVDPQFTTFVESQFYFIENPDPFRIFLQDTIGDIQKYVIEMYNADNQLLYSETIVKSRRRDRSVFDITSVEVKAKIEKKFGKKKAQNMFPVGRYIFKITAYDYAKNKLLKELDNIYFYDKNSQIWLEMPQNSFSPNGDTVSDELIMIVHVPIKEQVKSWSIAFHSYDTGKIVKETRNENQVPVEYKWDGKDNSGMVLKTGYYFVVFRVFLDDRTTLQSTPYQIILDLEGPNVTLKPEKENFTPDGDGRDDLINFYTSVQDMSPLLAYKLIISDKNNKVIKKFQGKGKPSYIISWNGIQDNNLIVNSFEEFYVQLQSIDKVGNIGPSEKIKIKTGPIISAGIPGKEWRNLLRIQLPNIRFKRGSSKPTVDSFPVLESLKLFVENKVYKYDIEIIGHSDYVGSRGINKTISYERALFVKEYLIHQGLELENAKATGKAYEEPLFKDKSDIYQERNRRVEIVFRLKQNPILEEEK